MAYVRAVKKCNFKNIEKIRVKLQINCSDWSEYLGITKPTYFNRLVHGGWTRQELRLLECKLKDTCYKTNGVLWLLK